VKPVAPLTKHGILLFENVFDPTEHLRFLAKQDWVDVGQNALYLKHEVDGSQYLFASLHTEFFDLVNFADEFYQCHHYRFRHQDKKFAHRKSSGKTVFMHPHVDAPTAPPEVNDPDDFTTAIVYINDGYKGGKLIVDTGRFQKKVALQPKAGSIVMLNKGTGHGVSKGRDDRDRIVAVTHIWRD